MKKYYLFTLVILMLVVSSSAQNIYTIAGTGVVGTTGDGGMATLAEINDPYATAVDAAGNIYIADYGANRVRKINAAGIISTFAGNGSSFSSGDGGAASLATISGPIGVAVDTAGNVYISEYLSGRIRKVNASGIISTFASGLSYPTGLCTDLSGNLYIANQGGHKVMKVTPAGAMTTVAGSGVVGYSGDGSSALSAALNDVTGVAVDRSGNIYIAMWNDEHLRMVNSSGIISTVAGTGAAGFSGDGGAATSATLSQPYGCAVDATGNVYIADVSNNRIRKITVATGIITTVAGDGIMAYSGDGGAAIAAGLGPDHVFIDAAGNIYISDYQNQRIRIVRAQSIVGLDTICVGSSITFTDTASGSAGVWSSSNIAIATVNSAGVVSAIAAGTDTISYTITGIGITATATKVITVVAGLPVVGAIHGPSHICAGVSVYLTDSTLSGTWSSENPGIAFVVSTIGLVNAVLPGVDTIYYSVTNVCGTTTVYAADTVLPGPVVSNILPDTIATICIGGTLTLTDSTAGGVWGSSNVAIASVNTAGVVTGINTGSASVIYNVTNASGCTASTAREVIINHPVSLTISGDSTVCANAATTLTASISGGTWGTTNAGIAYPNSSGYIQPVMAGTVMITYSVSNTCSSIADSFRLRVKPVPVADSISGLSTVCTSTTTTLTDPVPGGVWSCTNPEVATVNSSGAVTTTSLITIYGNVANIYYTVSNSCGTAVASKQITVDSHLFASEINGYSAVCVGGNILVFTDEPGGTFSAGNGNLTITPGGFITGVTAGTDTITYTLGNVCNTVYSTEIITIENTPVSAPVTGLLHICTGATSLLSDTLAHGTWSSSNAAIATISASGLVRGISAGTDTIIYTFANYCGTVRDTAVMTIAPLPATGAITGTDSICAGLRLTLADTAAGGSWTSSDPLVASVSSTGGVTGINAGTATISYGVTNSCTTSYATVPFKVNALPVAGAITGSGSVCSGSLLSLADTSLFGVWSSGNPAVATVSTSGLVSAITSGADTVYYTVTNSCGTALTHKALTVNPTRIPDAITGAGAVCTGVNITLSDDTLGGTWSTTNSNAAVTSAGIVTGVLPGTDTINYTVSNSFGCGETVSAVISVNLSPAAGIITGTASVCNGNTISLTDAVTGGVWSSSNIAVATVSTAGSVNTIAAGADTIYYSVTNSCGTAIARKAITVNPVRTADAITGAGVVCTGVTITLSDDTLGGTWSTTNSNAAITSTGVVTGVSTGTDTINYTVANSFGCGETVSTVITINLSPSVDVITGTASVCNGGVVSLADATTGGLWSSSNTTIASVSTGGIVTGIAPGTDTVYYRFTNSCGTVGSFKVFTVDPVPAPGAVTGDAVVCTGNSILLGDDLAGGVWSSSNGNISLSSAGNVTGIAPGLDTVTYTVTNLYHCTQSVSTVLTVNLSPSVAAVSGGAALCQGSSIYLADAAMGGVWGATNAYASVSGSGMVTANAAGIDTITYSVTNGCGTVVAKHAVVVNPLPVVYSVTGGGSYCAGGGGESIGLTGSEAGIGYQLFNNGFPSVTVFASGVALGFPLQSAAGTYTVLATDTVTGCTSNMAGSAVIIIEPLTYDTVTVTTGSTDQVCAGTAVTYTAVAAGGGMSPAYQWSVNGVVQGVAGNTFSYTPADGDVVNVVLSSSAVCATPLAPAYSVAMTVLANGAPSVSIAAAAIDSVCAGFPVTYTPTVSFGGSTPVYTWFINGSVEGAGPTFTFYPTANDTVYAIVSSNYACRTADSATSSTNIVQVHPLVVPSVVVISIPGIAITTGATDTLVAIPANAGPSPYYQWYINDTLVSGANTSTFITSDLKNGDSVSCLITSDGICAGISTFNYVIANEFNVGVQQLTAAQSSISLLPDPNNGSFAIKGYWPGDNNAPVALTITNMLGQVIYTGSLRPVNNQLNENISLGDNIAKGIYIMQLQRDNDKIAVRFIVGN